MLVERVWTPAGAYRVAGDGYAPAGPVEAADGAAPAADDLLGRLGAVAGTLAVQLLIVYLPFLQGLFDTQALEPVQLAAVLATSTVAFIAVEIEKWVRPRTSP